MSRPKVTAIIINWNSGDTLARCLGAFESLEQAHFQTDKVIVVDNASSDGSLDNLEPAPGYATIIRSPSNLGFGPACNIGAAEGEADYYLFLNPDVHLPSGSLDSLVQFAETPKQKRKTAVFSLKLVGENGATQRHCARFPTPGRLIPQTLGLDRLLPTVFPPHFMLEWDHESTRRVDQVPGGFFFIRSDVFRSLGGFDERFFMYFEDVDLNLRVSQAGWETWYFAGASAFHAGQGTTDQIKAGRLAYFLSSRNRFVRKHFPPLAAAAVMLSATFLEIFPRLAGKLLGGSWSGMRDVLSGYLKYWAGLLPGVTGPDGEKV